ncbi:Thioredoxin-like protein AAED1 chloroplastic [Bienertia sinuspersici]
MALSTSTTICSNLPSKSTKYPSAIYIPKQTQISVNGFFPQRKTPNKLRPSYYRPLFTAPAISSSQAVGSFAANETNISMLDKALVFDLKGNGVQITDLWRDRKAVIAFARHFG